MLTAGDSVDFRKEGSQGGGGRDGGGQARAWPSPNKRVGVQQQKTRELYPVSALPARPPWLSAPRRAAGLLPAGRGKGRLGGSGSLTNTNTAVGSCTARVYVTHMRRQTNRTVALPSNQPASGWFLSLLFSPVVRRVFRFDWPHHPITSSAVLRGAGRSEGVRVHLATHFSKRNCPEALQERRLRRQASSGPARRAPRRVAPRTNEHGRGRATTCPAGLPIWPRK